MIDGGAPWFGLDLHSEWFPVLARRVSVGTVQGHEWLPGREFYRRMTQYAELAKCRDTDAECVEQWSVSNRQDFTHILLVHHVCCERLRSSLRASAVYAIVYEQPGLMILQRR